MDILTKIWVVEEDELLPAVLGHHLQDDLVKVDGRADHQGVVVCSRQAAGQRAGGARRPGGRALDEEVGDVHGVCERLKAACWHAANGTDQRQDAAIHQLAGWREKGGAERKEGSCYSHEHAAESLKQIWHACGRHQPLISTVICGLQMHGGQWFLFHKSAHESNRKRRKRENWCVCCLVLLFIIYFEYLLCTNYKQYGKKWNPDADLLDILR